LAVPIEECSDWELREKLLSILKNKPKEELLRAIAVITEELEGKEVFERLIFLLGKTEQPAGG